MKVAVVLFFLLFIINSYNIRAEDAAFDHRQDKKEICVMKFKVKDIMHNQSIPSQYTCDGNDVSPEISWGELPEGTLSLALSVIDPDAPMGAFTHWLVYDIDPNAGSIPMGGPLPAGTKEAENDFGATNYDGPCPPSGEHRYFFTLYALDVTYLEGATKASFQTLVKQHMIDSAEVVGLYKRN